MKFCATQPAWLASMLSFPSVPLTLSRNALASAAVGAGVDDEPRQFLGLLGIGGRGQHERGPEEIELATLVGRDLDLAEPG